MLKEREEKKRIKLQTAMEKKESVRGLSAIRKRSGEGDNVEKPNKRLKCALKSVSKTYFISL